MKIRLLAAAVVISLGAFAMPPQETEAHARKMAAIHKLLELTGGNKMADQMFAQMGQMIRASGPGGAGSEKMLEEFRKEMDLNKIMQIVASAYDKNLSAEDIQGLLAFYQSEPGRHMIAAMPQINSEMMSQLIPMSQEIAQKVMKRLQEPKEK